MKNYNIADLTTLPSEVVDIFRKYRIISVQENSKVEVYTTTNLRKSRDENGAVLGDGPLIDQNVLHEMVLADSSPGYAWLDWMFFQCGGGLEAQNRSKQALEQVKERYMDERVRGYRDMRGHHHDAISLEEAQAKWSSVVCKFSEVLLIGDQDMVEKLQIFGFFRRWPGLNNIYKNAVDTVKAFLALEAKIVEMNASLIKRDMSGKVVLFDSKQYATVEALSSSVVKVERFYASEAARNDIRMDVVHEDDVISLVCPLTYAAAVRYGWDGWPFANQEAFENNLESTSNWNDAWKNTVGRDAKIIVYIRFNVPMPAWVVYDRNKNKFVRYTFQNLALFIPQAKLNEWLDAHPEMLTDEEGRQHSIGALRALFLGEITRNDDPANEECPICCGPRVFISEEDVNAIMAHVRTALQALQAWTAKFDVNRVVVNYLPKEGN